MTTFQSPEKHLAFAGKVYPNAWKQIEAFRNWKNEDNDAPTWPSWCFLPFAAWAAIVSEENPDWSLNSSADVARLAALGTWRYTQGIYRFDPDVYEELKSSPISGAIPSEVLLRIPQWCIYIETPGMNFYGDEFTGMWVQLEWDVKEKRTELRLLLNMETQLMPHILHIGEWSFEEGVKKTLEETAKQAEKKGIKTLKPTFEVCSKMAEFYRPIVSLILFLCTEEPDIQDHELSSNYPQRPRPKRTKKGWKLFPANKTHIWNVGNNIGEVLRTGKATAKSNLSVNRKGPAPHIRRAHWHGFWRGPKNGKQKYFVKWLNPILVTGEEEQVDTVPIAEHQLAEDQR